MGTFSFDPITKGKEGVYRRCTYCKKTKRFFENRKICSTCRKFIGQVKSGVFRAPDIKDINVTGYKEPMEKVKDGFGYFGAITKTNDGGHIQCHTCGYYFASLGTHVKQKHAMEPKEYKEKYGLRLKEGLVSATERLNRQRVYNKTPRENLKNLRKAWKGNKKKRERGELKTGGDMWTAQTRNEKGLCREQTIAKLKFLADSHNGRLTYGLVASEYGHGFRSVILHWFGTWDNALKEAGIKSFLMSRKELREQDIDEIPDIIKAFYEREGRTPQSSDFDSLAELPNSDRVSSLFGTLNNARRVAEVPVLVQVKRHWVEIDPGERGYELDRRGWRWA